MALSIAKNKVTTVNTMAQVKVSNLNECTRLTLFCSEVLNKVNVCKLGQSLRLKFWHVLKVAS